MLIFLFVVLQLLPFLVHVINLILIHCLLLFIIIFLASCFRLPKFRLCFYLNYVFPIYFSFNNCLLGLLIFSFTLLIYFSLNDACGFFFFVLFCFLYNLFNSRADAFASFYARLIWFCCSLSFVLLS